MRLYEVAGRIVKGVNTTPDVGVNQTSIEAKKFGNTVDKDGKPPLLSKKYAKNTSPNKAYNLGLSETYTPLEIAIMEGGHSIDEKTKTQRTQGDLFNSLMEFDMNSLKRKAAQYLGKNVDDKLSKSDQRKLQAKTNKMKKSEKKAERQHGVKLAKGVAGKK